MSDTFSAELLKAMEAEITRSEDEEGEEKLIKVKYQIIPGLRINSELLWAYEEMQLYYENAYSKKSKLKAYIPVG